MKYLVVSDTHGNIKRVLDIYREGGGETAYEGIIHLGDYARDAADIEDELGCRMYSVLGNCDGDYGSGDFKVLDTEAGRILLTHGHAQRVKSTYMNLVYRAQELDCVAALFGHTHVPVYDTESGIILLNPGSITYPADGSDGSYAVLDIEGGEINAAILYYNRENTAEKQSGKSQKGKVSGGHLRDLLNYSDRF